MNDIEWYHDEDTGSIFLDLSQETNNQLCLILKKDGTVGYSFYNNELKCFGNANSIDFKNVLKQFVKDL